MFVGFYMSEHPTGKHASKSTFSRCFRDNWRTILQFRNHDKVRCTLCAKYSQQRQLAQTAEARSVTESQHSDHIRQVFADRSVYSRLQRMSASSCQASPSHTEVQSSDSTVLTLCIDGMDQATLSPFDILAILCFVCSAWLLLASIFTSVVDRVVPNILRMS